MNIKYKSSSTLFNNNIKINVDRLNLMYYSLSMLSERGDVMSDFEVNYNDDVVNTTGYEYSVKCVEGVSNMSDFGIGDFVKVNISDVELKGQVFDITDELYKLIIKTGNTYNLVSFSRNDGSFELTEELKNFNFEVNSDEVIERVKNIRKSKKKSKVDMIYDLLVENPDLVNNRKECISLAVSMGISTVNGCSTFFNTAKKKFLNIE